MRILVWLRWSVAFVSLVAMTSLFVFPMAWVVRWLGGLSSVQLVPAVMAGSIAVLIASAVSVFLFGRLYCSVICPLGIAQDVVRLCLSWIIPRRVARPLTRSARVVRLAILILFVVGLFFGLTGLIAPYGIFGRFLTVCVKRAGEPALAVTIWAASLFGFVLAMSLVRARWWCNRVCPVGTFLGLFSRFAVFRVRINRAKCVTCGLCAKACDKGALSVRDDKSIAVDSASCVTCFDCAGSCKKGALRFLPKV